MTSLFPHLWPDVGPCPFVVDQDAAMQVVLQHYDAGRDASYVTVSRGSEKELSQGSNPLSDKPATLRFASFVQGTTIIYDATDETLQGKARPFACDLNRRSFRLYALLPFQIEGTAMQVKNVNSQRYLKVAFVDARGEKIQAAMPFELRLIDRDESTLASKDCATDREGQFVYHLYYGAAAPMKAVVRSRLTGREETMEL